MKKSEELQERLKELKEKIDVLKKDVYGKYSLERYREAFYEYFKRGGVQMDKEKEWLVSEIVIEQRREVEVGDGVTVCLYTDKEAYTVIKRTPKTITIQRDKATLLPDFKPEFEIGGFCAHCTNNDEQEYTYERDDNGEIATCHWSEKEGCFMKGAAHIINGRFEYYDYNF